MTLKGRYLNSQGHILQVENVINDIGKEVQLEGGQNQVLNVLEEAIGKSPSLAPWKDRGQTTAT